MINIYTLKLIINAFEFMQIKVSGEGIQDFFSHHLFIFFCFESVIKTKKGTKNNS